MYKNKKQSSGKKWFGIILVVLIIAAGIVIFFYERAPHKKSANLINNSATTTPSGTTSKPTPHQLSTNNNPPGQSGGAVDKQGQTSGTLPPQSEWVSSNSGAITLQQPTPNSTVASGDTLSGLANVSTVRFILTDSSVGLIAQGNLNVVNGKFSGVLQFTPHSSSGKLQVYYPNPSNGAEEDIIDVNVSFNHQ